MHGDQVDFEDFGLISGNGFGDGNGNGDSFESEMQKVAAMLEEAGSGVGVSTEETERMRNSLDRLMGRAMDEEVEQGGRKEGRREKVRLVHDLIKDFMALEQQRAEVLDGEFDLKRPSLPIRIRDPTRVLPDKVTEHQGEEHSDFGHLLDAPDKKPVRNFNIPTRPTASPPGTTTTTISAAPPDFSQILIGKIQAHHGDKGEDFGDYLDLPDVDYGGDYDYVPPPISSDISDYDDDYEDFSAVLLDKVRAHQGQRGDGFSGALPAKEEQSQPLKSIDLPEDYEEYEDFSVLPEKIRQHQDEFRDDGSGHDFLDLPDTTPNKAVSFAAPENSLSRPSLAKGGAEQLLPSVPRSTTPASPPATAADVAQDAAVTEAFVQDLRDSTDKAELEDSIMNMIIRDPEVVVETLTGMFEHEDDASEERTRADLQAMIAKDPIGVTVAFSDLVLKQNEMIEATTAAAPGEEHDIFTPEVPHKYEDPPEEVRGQLLRLSMGDIQKLPSPTPPINIEVGTTASSGPSPPPRMPGQVLDAMLDMIDAGELSHEDIIEEMINNGMLPVEITEFGRIPITVGTSSLSKPRKEAAGGSSKVHPERVTAQRMRELLSAQREPSFVVRDDRPKMVSVDITDPDGDFEEMKHRQQQQQQKSQPLRQRPKNEKDSEPSDEDKKAIEVEASMMKLFEQGLITEMELSDMMTILRGGNPYDEREEERRMERPPHYVQQFRTPSFSPFGAAYANSYSHLPRQEGEEGGVDTAGPSEPLNLFPDTESIIEHPGGSSYMSFELGGGGTPPKGVFRPILPTRNHEALVATRPPLPQSFPPPIRFKPVVSQNEERPFPPQNSYVDFTMGNLRPRPSPSPPPPPYPSLPPFMAHSPSPSPPLPPPPPPSPPPSPTAAQVELLKENPSVQEFSQAKTNVELEGSSFEDVFDRLTIVDGHGFDRRPEERDDVAVGRGPHYAVGYPHEHRPQPPLVLESAPPGPGPTLPPFAEGAPLDEAFVAGFLDDPPRHPYHGKHRYGTNAEPAPPPPAAAAVSVGGPGASAGVGVGGFSPSDRDTFIGRLIDTPPSGLPHQQQKHHQVSVVIEEQEQAEKERQNAALRSTDNFDDFAVGLDGGSPFSSPFAEQPPPPPPPQEIQSPFSPIRVPYQEEQQQQQQKTPRVYNHGQQVYLPPPPPPPPPPSSGVAQGEGEEEESPPSESPGFLVGFSPFSEFSHPAFRPRAPFAPPPDLVVAERADHGVADYAVADHGVGDYGVADHGVGDHGVAEFSPSPFDGYNPPSLRSRAPFFARYNDFGFGVDRNFRAIREKFLRNEERMATF